MWLQLVVVEGVKRGSAFPLPVGQVLTLGRASNQAISLPDATVGLRHAEVGREEGGAWVRDLGSRHGCQVNGARIEPEKARSLCPGDFLLVGQWVRLQLTGLVEIERAWLGHDDGTVLRLAQAIADRGAFTEMPLLAGALAKAGCTDADLLRYGCAPGTEACARWVLELLLREASLAGLG